MRYIPHTPAEVAAMLARIGVDSVDKLFETVPESYRLKQPLNLQPTLDEVTLMSHMESLAGANTAALKLSFLGAGMYDHHIPPAVDQLLLRSEFYTAYTPYQAEMSQGTLQSMFEFQTIVCELLGMDVANGSMYDAASATAEAVLMARRVSGKNHVVMSRGVHPEYIETVRTYCDGLDDGKAEISFVDVTKGLATDVAALAPAITDNTACIVVGYPNVFGCVEDLEKIRAIADARGVLLVTVTAEPYALALLRPPGEFGVDIAVGEGQGLAVPPQFGGPGVGLFACKQAFIQKMPGRLVGETVDAAGKRGFVLTLSTREQHIRRERATSNICTNHGLIALAMTIRTAMLGKTGFVQVAKECLNRAEYVKGQLRASGAYEIVNASPTFNEFVVRSKGRDAQSLVDALGAKGVLAGVALSRWYKERTHDLLLAVTERHRTEDLDRLVSLLTQANKEAA